MQAECDEAAEILFLLGQPGGEMNYNTCLNENPTNQIQCNEYAFDLDSDFESHSSIQSSLIEKTGPSLLMMSTSFTESHFYELFTAFEDKLKSRFRKEHGKRNKL